MESIGSLTSFAERVRGCGIGFSIQHLNRLPLEVLSQPDGTSVGDKLKSILTNNQQYGFESFHFVVAYVKKSGVNQLAVALQQFKNSGPGVEVKGVVGIDDNTSVQGLQHLLPLCDAVWVYHNRSPTSTFHPKLYIFEKPLIRGSFIVGSSNLTAGGLYTNYEVNTYSDYNLSDQAQRAQFDAVKRIFQDYSTPSIFCHVLTPQYLQELYNDGYLFDEKTRGGKASGDERSESQARGRMRRVRFGLRRISPPGATLPTSVTLPKVRYLRRSVERSSYQGFVTWCRIYRSAASVEIAARARGKNNLSGHVHSSFYGLRQFFIAYPNEWRRLQSEDPNTYHVFQDPGMEARLRRFVLRNAVNEQDFLVDTWKSYLPLELGGRATRRGGAIGSLNRMMPLLADYLRGAS